MNLCLSKIIGATIQLHTATIGCLQTNQITYKIFNKGV